jgi:hypothetical protein
MGWNGNEKLIPAHLYSTGYLALIGYLLILLPVAHTGSTPAPAVIRHAYVNHSITGEKQTAKCASCGSVISEKRGLPPALLGRFLELY